MRFERQEEFRRNEDLEDLLEEINGILEPAEDEILEGYRMPKYPTLFVVGAPRCGSTLMIQWLAKTRKFAYPTNLLSRFYGAPYIGAKIQQLLTAPEFSFRNEILDFNNEISFKSKLGKTKGALEPNEFWYFWRRFIPNIEPEYLDAQLLERINGKKFAAELAAIEAVFDKPIAMKGHILEFNIPFLSSLLEKALFLFVRRKPFYNIQSLLESRIKYYGNRKAWYSVKPREYDMLKDLDAFEQVAGQVYFTNNAIEQGFSQIDASRWLQVNYEEFCADPQQVFYQILEKLSQQGFRTDDWNYVGQEQFQSTNQIRLPEDDCRRITNAYNRFSGADLLVP